MKEKRMEMIKKLQLSTFTTDFFFPFFLVFTFFKHKTVESLLGAFALELNLYMKQFVTLFVSLSMLNLLIFNFSSPRNIY